MVRALKGLCLGLFWSWSACAWAAPAAAPWYVLQANDPDPTSPTSQPAGRWYHWLGCDPAVTHLETGLADRLGGDGRTRAAHPVGRPPPPWRRSR